MSERTHFVYEAYDSDGLLLYVGCTGQPEKRYKAHMAGGGDARGWFNPFVTDWRVSGPYTPLVALKIERDRIEAKQPIWNGHSRENFGGKRKLIKDYLDAKGLTFIPNPRANRPLLVEKAA